MIKILTKSRRAGTIKAVQARLYFITQGKTDVNGNFGRIDLASEELSNAPKCSLIRPFSREAIFAFSIQYSRSGPISGAFAGGAQTTRPGGRLIAAPTVRTGNSHAKLLCAASSPCSEAVRAALVKTPVAAAAIRFHWPARSREGVGSMGRDSPVERNGSGDASPWDARRGIQWGTGGRSPRRVLGTFPR